MTTASLSDSISYNFMVQMIPHHEAAIRMSQNILQYTSDSALRTIAGNIITEQTKSIHNMCYILHSCKTFCNSSQDLWTYQNGLNSIMSTMFADMNTALVTNQIGDDFMREMIPNHIGAIRMARHTLAYCICPSLKPILNAIITSQEQGVQEMCRLLRRKDCSG